MRIGGIKQGGSTSTERREKRHGPKAPDESTPLIGFQKSVGVETKPLARSVKLVDDSDEPPPPQEEMRRRSIRLRQMVDIIMELDWSNDTMDVRASIIHEVDPKGRLLMAQTSPPVLRSQIGKVVELTFLSQYPSKMGHRWLRVGYHTPILGIVEDHQLGPDFRETVLAFKGPTKLVVSTARISPRMEPTPDMDLTLRLWPDGQQVTLLDLAAGGVRFSHPTWMEFAPGTRLDVALCTANATIPVRGRVLRHEELNSRASATVLQFRDMDRTTAVLVRRLLTEMVRHRQAQMSGVTT